MKLISVLFILLSVSFTAKSQTQVADSIGAILPICVYGDSILYSKSIDISRDYPNLDNLIQDMHRTMDAQGGCGLAAPQIGLAIRLIVMNLDGIPNYDGFRKTFINPHIVCTDGLEMIEKEGCLSLFDLYEPVPRPAKVLVRYLDENFMPHEEWLDGFLSRCMQHEVDHLEGILFINRLPEKRRETLERELKVTITKQP